MYQRLTALMALLLLASCQPESNPPTTVAFTGEAMTMPYCVMVEAPLTSEQRSKVESTISELFDEVDRRYNNWNPASEVSRLNATESSTPFLLSPELSELLQLVDRWHLLTEGRFDPTLSPVQKLWRCRLESYCCPSTEELLELRDCVGWNRLRLLDETLVLKESPTLSLDLGGVAKGYAVDHLTQRLQALGFRHLYVSWSGEIRLLGGHPDNRPWRVAIQAPQKESDAILVLDIFEGALATSGNYLQCWMTDQGCFTHICDPRTLRALPVNRETIASATVEAQSCAVADMVATALMLCPDLSSGMRFQEELQTTSPEIGRIWLFTSQSTPLSEWKAPSN